MHPREEQGALFDPLADRPRVGHGPHLEYPGEVDAGQGRANRWRSRRQHELVVGLGRYLAGCDIAEVDGLLVRRDADGLATRSSVNGELRAERVCIRDQKTRFLFDDAADMVGQTAVGVRDIRSAFHHEDLRVFVQPAETRRTRRATRYSTDDDDLHFCGLSVRDHKQDSSAQSLLAAIIFAAIRSDGLIVGAHSPLD